MPVSGRPQAPPVPAPPPVGPPEEPRLPGATDPSRQAPRLAWIAVSLLVAVAGCAAPQPATETADAQVTGVNGAAACPARATAPARLPGTDAEHLSLSYWLDRMPPEELDRPLLTTAQIADYNARIGRRHGEEPTAQRDLLTPMPDAVLEQSLQERIAFVAERIHTGEYVKPDGTPVSAEELAGIEAMPELSRKRPLLVALETVQLRCAAYPGALRQGGAGAGSFDRNACSAAHAQEPMQVLGMAANGMRLVRTRFSLGFIEGGAPTLQLGKHAAEAFVRGPLAITLADATVEGRDGERLQLAAHTMLPHREDGRLVVATASGVRLAAANPSFVTTRRPLTRRGLLEAAFSFLGAPYGFGGADGGRDCSRLTLDLFESFDLALPRFSGWQARAGSSALDMPKGATAAERLALIERAHQDGAALLYLPGHIMLYLGRDGSGTPMVLHALGEYAQPCAGGGETVLDVRRTTVSTLALGRGSSRTSLLERITRVVVVGGPPRAATRPDLPAPEVCGDSAEMRIFKSPARPTEGGKLRVIATGESDPGQAQLWLWDPDGQPLDIAEHSLGGPPFTRWGAIEGVARGPYTAVVGDGDHVLACKRIRVRPRVRPSPASSAEAPIWAPRWKWERDTENLWSAFVEQLFDYPLDDGRTWTNLHSLLRDESRNLLFGHKGMAEEKTLELQPDCADLPYSLRAYFAWKLDLPFGFRRCTRGGRNRPPRCGELHTNLAPRERHGDLAAFDHFIGRTVRSGVHSASGRTHPRDDDSDLYPVPLTRSALRPGTVYADPHGHVMMLSRWYPQGPEGSDKYGVLMAAEAQPDGTIGRRRFWEGSFLFDPSTDHVGAGFKHFRPLVFDRQTGEITPLPNAALRRVDDYPVYSRQQYGIDRTTFYDRMDALINPRPLDPKRRMVALVDALEESVRRRVVAVENGENHLRERNYAPIEMPSGYALFETTGAWEDFSTPARDMRLLVSIDTVLGFLDRVARQPERFVVAGRAPDPEALQRDLDAALAERRFTYQKSDGSSQTLTLADVVARREAFELAYNPNDCTEIRWGADGTSEEAESCRRRAPRPQRARMAKYRAWFAARSRPPRGTR